MEIVWNKMLKFLWTELLSFMYKTSFENWGFKKIVFQTISLLDTYSDGLFEQLISNWTFTIDKISLSYLFTFIFVLICRCDWITETFWTDGLRLGFFAFLYEKIFGRNWCCDHAGLSRLISSSVMELLLRWVKFRKLHGQSLQKNKLF